MAAAFGTGTEGVDGVRKTLYPSTNTTEVYVLPFTRMDDGGSVSLLRPRLSACSVLAVLMVLMVHFRRITASADCHKQAWRSNEPDNRWWLV